MMVEIPKAKTLAKSRLKSSDPCPELSKLSKNSFEKSQSTSEIAKTLAETKLKSSDPPIKLRRR